MKAVMYHYVRPAPADLPHFHYLHIEDFRRQLDWFGSNIGFASRDEVMDALGGGPLPRGVVLTFDDGFIDHAALVLPELSARGLWGIFYVPTGVYETGKLLDVHRIHLLLGRFGGGRIREALDTMIAPDMLVPEHVARFGAATYARQDNDEATTYVKRCLNYYIAEEHRTAVLDALMQRFVDSESKIAAGYYVGRRELVAMAAAGMLIGSHGVSHRVMSKLSAEEQKREIDDSFAAIKDMAGPQVCRTFCYPYGGQQSFSPLTEELLQAAGCAFSFCVEPREVGRQDLIARPQALPRFDCNGFPHGKASCGRARPTTVAAASR